MDGESKAITLQGINHNLSKIETKDGMCEDLVNLRFKDGSWRPSGEGKLVFSLPDGKYKHLYIHTNEYRHLLGVADGQLWWIANLTPKEDAASINDEDFVFTALDEPISITAIVGDNVTITQNGHLITVIDEDNDFEYFVYKTTTKEYKEVQVDLNGTQTDRTIYPFGKIHFNLSYDEKDTISEEVGEQWSSADDAGSKYWDGSINPKNNADPITLSAVSDVITKDVIHNKLIELNTKATDKNLFTGRFLVCAAIELYDESLVYASNPVLLAPREKPSSTQSSNYYKRSVSEDEGTVQDSPTEYINNDEENNYFAYSEYVSAVNNNVGTSKFGSIPNTRESDGTAYYGNSELGLVHNAFEEKSDNYFRNGITGFYKTNIIPSFGVIKCSRKDTTDDYEYYRGNAYPAPTIPVFSASAYAYRDAVWRKGQTPYSNGYLGSKVKCAVRGARLCMHFDNTNILRDNEDVFNRIVILVTPQVTKPKLTEDESGNGFIAISNSQRSYSIDERYESEGSGIQIKFYNCDDFYSMAYCPPVKNDDDISYELMHSPFFELRGYDKKSIKELESNCVVNMDGTQYAGVVTALGTDSSKMLTADGLNRYSYLPKCAYMYNGRLHIANYVTSQFHGYPVDMFQLNNHSISFNNTGKFKNMLALCEGNNDDYYQFTRSQQDFKIDESMVEDGIPLVIVKTKVSTADGDQIVCRYIKSYSMNPSSKFGRQDFIEDLGPLLVFPDYRATHMTIMIVEKGGQAYYVKYRTFELTAHTYMNFAYYMNPLMRPIKLSSFKYMSSATLDNTTIFEQDNYIS